MNALSCLINLFILVILFQSLGKYYVLLFSILVFHCLGLDPIRLQLQHINYFLCQSKHQKEKDEDGARKSQLL